jgi:thioredoxin 1
LEGTFMAHAITKKNYELEILDAVRPVILDVYAPWCGPCQFMKPIFEQLEKEFNSEIIFTTLNVEEDRELSIELGISSIPAFLFFNNGTLVAKEVGSMSHEDFVSKIKKHFQI